MSVESTTFNNSGILKFTCVCYSFVVFVMAYKYSNEEYCNIHFYYGAAFGNSLHARRLYAERFPNMQCLCANTFQAVHDRLRDTGRFDVSMINTGQSRTVRSVAFDEEVLERFEENPHTSTRAVGSAMNASKNFVWRVLKEEGMHAFHMQKVHALKPQDYPRRVDCCRWFIHKTVDNPNFLKNVLFTDEASFNREGIFNSRNSHVWAVENPHETFTRGYQDRFAVNVWAGMLGDTLVGPYILPNRLNSVTYLVFLRDILPVLLEDVALEDRLNMTFQHDGAPAHFGQNVRDHLYATFGQHWVGRGGPTPWPPRSPDLTPLDFYLWGRMKTLVYSTPVDNEIELVGRIVEAAAVIQEENVFEHVRVSLENRFTVCNRVGGGHIENLL